MSGESGTASITPVGEIMSEQLETINFSNTAQESAIKMSDRNVSSLVVLDDNGKAIGIITERDLVRRVCTRDVPSNSVNVENVISSPVKNVSPETSVDEVADVMVSNKVRHVVIVDRNQKPVGIISATDIVAYVRENSQNVAKISSDVIDALEREGRHTGEG
ncbi:MAG TPA: CBS domain-containing protein [Nitrososphaera sp.]|jgi:signal-transduction protein with cAMP-binding, CBS, and nucleotidyltransferase domain|nr:CBS domain-containing protein [Nitrososphaera sp.]